MCAAETKNVCGELMNNDELRIVLMGKTGVGKTATGNTILKKEEFISELSSSSVTTDCKKVRSVVSGREIAVIDTPELFDTRFSHEEVEKKMKLCLSLSAPGPHVFLVVLQVGRFTNEEKEIVEIIQKIFGENSSKHIIVIFTYGDSLKKSKRNIEDFITESPDLKEFIESIKERYIVFNNDLDDTNQVEMLFEMIDEMISENGGQHYTNEILQEAERAIQEEQARIQETNSTVDVQETRDRAERENSFLGNVLGNVLGNEGFGVAIAAGLVAAFILMRSVIQ